MKKMNNKGFSLVELIIVIAIMAVLVGVLAPQYLKYVESSRVQKDESALGEVLNATKIALSVEDVYNALPTGGATVTIADGVKVTASFDELTDEIAKTIPDEIDFTSKTYDGQSETITITVDTTNGTVNVVGGWLTAAASGT
jgi:type IV pilus assembly protein PilA